jgi:hypothetical protein
MVFFFSDFNYFQSDDRQVVNPMIMNAFLHDKVKLSRTEMARRAAADVVNCGHSSGSTFVVRRSNV